MFSLGLTIACDRSCHREDAMWESVVLMLREAEEFGQYPGSAMTGSLGAALHTPTLSLMHGSVQYL